MAKKLLFIINPRSGTGKAAKALCDMVQYYNSCGWEVTVHATQCAGDATEQVVRRGEEFDKIVCSGGDGTLSETLSGLMKLPAIR